MRHPAFTSQPQRINASWPVLISRPTEGRKLCWAGCLVTYRYASPTTVTHPNTSRPIKQRPGIELATIESHVSNQRHAFISLKSCSFRCRDYVGTVSNIVSRLQRCRRAGRPAGRWMHGPSSSRHSTAGQYGYVPLGRHIVK